ncbi:pitrilysin family protein [Isosphaeraceae bacterium EP7]
MARRSDALPSPAWAGDLPVHERLLSNGMKALVLPRRHAPAVMCDLYYPAGSVNEPAGLSGLAHFVEHMLFKGTERFPKGQIDRLAFVASGQSNAETAEDFTHYWFAFPSDRWELALAVEADRMRGAAFDPAEVESERGVIVEERARDQDSPMGRLDELHLALSYLRHPYRNPILGWPDDLARATVADLRAFYAAHYRPDGATLVVVGDVDPARALDRIELHFGHLAAGVTNRNPPPMSEPRQAGRRDFTLTEGESVARGLLGWHSVPLGHPDGPALDVLSDLMTCGRRSRLWDGLVETGKLATWVDAGHEPSRWAGQFLMQVEAAPGVEPRRVEAAIAGVVASLTEQGPTVEEMARSRVRLEAAWRWEQEDLAGLASGLGQRSLWTDWRGWQAEHRAAIAVTADDVVRVASTYLNEASLTVGWALPRPEGSVTVLLPSELAIPRPSRPVVLQTPEKPLDLTIPDGTARLVDYKPDRRVLANGLTILTERRPGTGVVCLDLYIDSGLLRESKPGLAHLTGRLLEEGTTLRDEAELAAAIEDIGGTLDVGATGASLRVRSEDLELAMTLLAEVIRTPAFPAEALAWAKERTVGELQGDRDDPSFRADLLFRGLIYGDHPYARDPRGNTREIGRLTLDDVRGHHAALFGADRATLIAAGDFDRRRLQSLLKTHFGSWNPIGGHLPVPARPPGMGRGKVRRVDHPGEQVHILMGHLGVPRNHPDYDALEILDHILGSGPGFTDRLSRIVRDELGLAYSVGGGMTDSADVEPGLFRIYAGTSPDDVDRAVAVITEQIRALHAGEFSDDEVDRARRYLAGSWVFDFQTVEHRAERLLELERWGLPLEDPIHRPGRLASITPKQVRHAAKVHLHPNSLVRVEYGPIRRKGQRARAECA